MSQQQKELSNLLSSITGIKKSILESHKDHIIRCYENMVYQITAEKRGTFESLDHYIICGLGAYAASLGILNKKIFESKSDYEYRCYKQLEALYSTQNCGEILINIFSNKSSWSSYSSKAHAIAKSSYPTLEVTYEGKKRIAEIIPASHVRTGDVIRNHVDGYGRFKFSKVVVGNAYYDDGVCINMLYEDGRWYKIQSFEKFQRIIF